MSWGIPAVIKLGGAGGDCVPGANRAEKMLRGGGRLGVGGRLRPRESIPALFTIAQIYF